MNELTLVPTRARAMRAGTAEQQQHERKGEEMSVNRGKGQAGRTKESEMGQDVATKV